MSAWYKEMRIGFGGIKTSVRILAIAFSSCLSSSELHYLTEQSAKSSVK